MRDKISEPSHVGVVNEKAAKWKKKKYGRNFTSLRGREKSGFLRRRSPEVSYVPIKHTLLVPLSIESTLPVRRRLLRTRSSTHQLDNAMVLSFYSSLDAASTWLHYIHISGQLSFMSIP